MSKLRKSHPLKVRINCPWCGQPALVDSGETDCPHCKAVLNVTVRPWEGYTVTLLKEGSRIA